MLVVVILSPPFAIFDAAFCRQRSDSVHRRGLGLCVCLHVPCSTDWVAYAPQPNEHIPIVGSVSTTAVLGTSTAEDFSHATSAQIRIEPVGGFDALLL